MSTDTSTPKSPATEAAERQIWDRALQSLPATHRQALLCFADRANWGRINDKNGCHWTWKGIVVPPYELAQHAVAGPISAATLRTFNPKASLDLTDAFIKERWCPPGHDRLGWDIFDLDSTGVLEIERIDEDSEKPNGFHTDKEAAHHVTRVAAENSPPEALALLHLFSKVLADVIQDAQAVSDGERLTYTFNAETTQTIKRMRYW